MSTILVVEPDVEERGCIEHALEAYEGHVQFLDSTQALLLAGEHDKECRLVIVDPDSVSVASSLLPKTLARFASVPVIVVCHDGLKGRVDAMLQASTHRSLPKPLCHEVLFKLIEHLIGANFITVGAKTRNTSQEAQADFPCSGTWSQRIQSMLVRVGSANVPVLLRGETGVGKEVIARKLHSYSPRADGPFVKLNCAALPSELVESELFGYERGAFTGAFKSTPGKFEMANRGTILLDEIGDMDPRLQAKLLQVLQDQEFFRLGAKESSHVDVRVMAASHCDFEKAICEKRFREDLYYRLNIIDIKIPPLRDRRTEIVPLCDYFLQKYATHDCPKLEVTPILRQVVMEYNWPGNVRELENAMRKYLVIRSPTILAAEIRQRTMQAKTVYVPGQGMPESFTPAGLTVEASFSGNVPETAHWEFEAGSGIPQLERDRESVRRDATVLHERTPPVLSRCVPISRQGTASALSRVDEVRRTAEAQAILNALNSTLWNRKRAATLLNVDYKALLYKMKKLGIGDKRVASAS